MHHKRKEMIKNRIKDYIPIVGLIILSLIFVQYHNIAQPVNDSFVIFGRQVSANFVVDLSLFSFIFISILIIIYIFEKKR
jgi:hypothetical protein